eukprot:scaffold26740_cov94-Skeletonema_dohrnii-CCMP3373.AAC.1
MIILERLKLPRPPPLKLFGEACAFIGCERLRRIAIPVGEGQQQYYHKQRIWRNVSLPILLRSIVMLSYQMVNTSFWQKRKGEQCSVVNTMERLDS